MSAKRVIVAIILLALAMGSFISGGFLLTLFMSVFIFVGIHELLNIAKAKGLNPPFYFIVVSSFILLGLAAFKLYDMLFPVFAISAILAFLIILFRGQNSRINDVSITLLMLIYGGVFPIHIMMLRNLDLGYVLLMFLVIASCDIGAYYTGKTFGRTPLWKEISPKKTIKGAFGGTVSGVIVSVLIGNYIGLYIINSIVVGSIITIVAQLGDLSESMLKREVGIKDSGTVFPGHGGVLDRTDSYIFTGVVAFYYFKFFVVG